MLSSHQSNQQDAGLHRADDRGAGHGSPTAGVYRVAGSTSGSQESRPAPQTHGSRLRHRQAWSHHQHERPEDEHVHSYHQQRALADPWQGERQDGSEGEQHLRPHGGRRGVGGQ